MSGSLNEIPADVRAGARRWLITLHSRSAGDAERLACFEWRKEHPSHDRAFLDAQRVWGMLGALDAQRDLHSNPERRVARFRRVAAMAAAVALFAVGVATLVSPAGGVGAWTADVRTAAGEQRAVVLEDGTSVQLNGATALSHTFAPSRREVRLLAGEAFFTVAHDESRPFLVEVGEARIRVTGTRFNVRIDDDRVTLTVEEGSVTASREGVSAETRVRPYEQVVWSSGSQHAPAAAVMSDSLAWRRGRLSFKSRPLTEVMEELERYRPGHVLVIGGDARSLPVTGTFETGDPEAVLTAVSRTLPVRVMRVTPFLTLIY